MADASDRERENLVSDSKQWLPSDVQSCLADDDDSHGFFPISFDTMLTRGKKLGYCVKPKRLHYKDELYKKKQRTEN